MLDLNAIKVSLSTTPAYRVLQLHARQIRDESGTPVKLNASSDILYTYITDYLSAIEAKSTPEMPEVKEEPMTADLENADHFHLTNLRVQGQAHDVKPAQPLNTMSATALEFVQEDGYFSLGCGTQLITAVCAINPQPTAPVYVYLKTGKFYSNGQSIVSKEQALMDTRKANHYLESASRRGLDFQTEPATPDAFYRKALMDAGKVNLSRTNMTHTPATRAPITHVVVLPKYQRPVATLTRTAAVKPANKVAPVKSYRVQPEPTKKVQVKSLAQAGQAYNYLQSNGVLDRRDSFKQQYQIAAWW